MLADLVALKFEAIGIISAAEQIMPGMQLWGSRKQPPPLLSWTSNCTKLSMVSRRSYPVEWPISPLSM